MELLKATLSTYVIVIAAFVLILIFKKVTKANSRISRKMTHILIGPIYILTWLLYPKDEPAARYCAMSIVLLIFISICYTLLLNLKEGFLSFYLKYQ